MSMFVCMWFIFLLFATDILWTLIDIIVALFNFCISFIQGETIKNTIIYMIETHEQKQ